MRSDGWWFSTVFHGLAVVLILIGFATGKAEWYTVAWLPVAILCCAYGAYRWVRFARTAE